MTASGSAHVSIRETLVLGRSGEIGGRLSNRSEAVVDGLTVYREDLDLSDPRARVAPGMLGGARVMDSVLQLGPCLSTPCLSADCTARQNLPDVVGRDGSTICDTFLLPGGAGTLTRFLGDDLAPSPLHQMLTSVT